LSGRHVMRLKAAGVGDHESTPSGGNIGRFVARVVVRLMARLVIAAEAAKAVRTAGGTVLDAQAMAASIESVDAASTLRSIFEDEFGEAMVPLVKLAALSKD
jgi:hypothetical protein